MPNRTSVMKRIEQVMTIFRQGRQLGEQNLNPEDLKYQLDALPVLFRSVAYEGASMGISVGRTMTEWNRFLSISEPHAVQIHIGLGWAIAEQQWPVKDTLSQFNPSMQLRAADGIGYYHGLFRKRQTVNAQIVPEEIQDPALTLGFDQGVGRSLWYVMKGDAQRIKAAIDSFPENRRPTLWRGIGTACTFVGGCSAAHLNDLWQKAAAHRPHLACGAVMAANSRIKADTPLTDAQLTIRCWVHLPIAEALSLLDGTRNMSYPQTLEMLTARISACCNK